jgi:hypothetical protein
MLSLPFCRHHGNSLRAGDIVGGGRRAHRDVDRVVGGARAGAGAVDREDGRGQDCSALRSVRGNLEAVRDVGEDVRLGGADWSR